MAPTAERRKSVMLVQVWGKSVKRGTEKELETNILKIDGGSRESVRSGDPRDSEAKDGIWGYNGRQWATNSTRGMGQDAIFNDPRLQQIPPRG